MRSSCLKEGGVDGLEVRCVVRDQHAAELGGALEDEVVVHVPRADGVERDYVEAALTEQRDQLRVHALVEQRRRRRHQASSAARSLRAIFSSISALCFL